MLILFLLVCALTEQVYECDPPEYYSFTVFLEKYGKDYPKEEDYRWR